MNADQAGECVILWVFAGLDSESTVVLTDCAHCCLQYPLDT